MIACKINSLLLTLLVLSHVSFCENYIPFMTEETPLMKAALKADIHEMKKLIKKGADVNAVYACDFPHGGSPVLRYAIDSGSLEAVSILLAAGANPNYFTESPVIYEDCSHKANIRNISMLSHTVNSFASLEIMEELIKYGAHVDEKSKWSPLMIASFRGYKEAVIVLLQAGADASAVNSMDNKTALDYAQEMEHKEIIKLLETK